MVIKIDMLCKFLNNLKILNELNKTGGKNVFKNCVHVRFFHFSFLAFIICSFQQNLFN